MGALIFDFNCIIGYNECSNVHITDNLLLYFECRSAYFKWIEKISFPIILIQVKLCKKTITIIRMEIPSELFEGIFILLLVPRNIEKVGMINVIIN